jgi:hypothetical protein
MSRTPTVPDEIYEKAARMANERHVPLEDFVSAALHDQLAARESISRRAARCSESAFQEALDEIPDAEPDARDRVYPLSIDCDDETLGVASVCEGLSDSFRERETLEAWLGSLDGVSEVKISLTKNCFLAVLPAC